MAGCECHERDSSYTCAYCKNLGHYGHMEQPGDYYQQPPQKYRTAYQFEFEDATDETAETTQYHDKDEFLMAHPLPIFMLFAMDGQLDYLQIVAGSESYTIRKRYLMDNGYDV